MCRHVCPVGHVTARETLTPHAWALTIESVTRGQLEWDRETAEVMYACADCGLCRSHCVTDQPLPDAIAAARAEIVRLGFAPAVVTEIDSQLRADAASIRQGDNAVRQEPARKARPATIALFVGDTGRDRRASSVDAAITLLRASGIEVVQICQARSSGLLASSLGLTETAESLGRSVIEEVEASGAHDLFVLSPADRWTFEYVYPRRLGLRWPVVAVHEITDVLARALAKGSLTFESRDDAESYAYHDPCHGPRVTEGPSDQSIRPAPRALLAAAVGATGARELFWRGHRAHPCGAIGGLEFTHPEIARRLADARLDDCERAGARVLVTEDPTCLTHLRTQGGGRVTVTGLYELLAQRLRP
jgi:Fe-S oxidoreductase